MCLLNSLIVQSTTVVAVTWSAAVHVIGQTPVLRLPETKQKWVLVFRLCLPN